MTIEREALKLALPLLEDCVNSYRLKYERPAFDKAIAAIKQALAPPEQAPTDELHSCPYAEEIHGNYEKVCDCDGEQTRQCAMGI